MAGMKNFHDFYFGLTGAERQSFVRRVGTSIGYAERVAGGFVLPSLVMAVRMARQSRGGTSVDGIVKTFEKKRGRIV